MEEVVERLGAVAAGVRRLHQIERHLTEHGSYPPNPLQSGGGRYIQCRLWPPPYNQWTAYGMIPYFDARNSCKSMGTALASSCQVKSLSLQRRS